MLDEVMGESYTPKGLIKATNGGYLYDYIAHWYYQMDTYELKEVLLAVLGILMDLCEDEDLLIDYILNELKNRDFAEE